jgi:hypothetical protein
MFLVFSELTFPSKKLFFTSIVLCYDCRTCCKTNNTHKKSITLEIIYSDQNRAAVAPELLVSLQQWNIEFVRAVPHITAKRFGQTAERPRIIWISPISRRNSEEWKDAYNQVIPIF